MKTHCISCGIVHLQSNYPKKCNCGKEMYENPIPVAVVLIPVTGKGLLLVKRGIPPQVGKWAFVGGFVDAHESHIEAAQREAIEEAGVRISFNLTLLGIEMSTNKKNMLIFMESEPVSEKDIYFQKNNEVSEIKFITDDFSDFAFDSHEKYARSFCQKHYGVK